MTYRDLPLEYVKKEEINKVIEYIKEQNFKKMNFMYPFSYFKAFKRYQIKKTQTSVEVIYYKDGGLRRIKWSSEKAYSESTNNSGMSGQDAYEYINQKYKENKKKHKNDSLFTDISGNKYSNEYKAIKKCVPAAINYCLKGRINKITDSTYKADVSSAYPTACCGSIPTLHGCKRVSGRVEPTAEYPFAFYIKSHHLAIYNELDTRKFKGNIYYPQYSNQADNNSWMPNDKIKIKDDETILCKDSGISLKSIFEELYNGRKEHEEFKFIMNAFIGRCQLNSNPIMSHLSAVVLARTVKAMLDRCSKLSAEGSVPIFISTDSIAWYGKPSECASFDKYLGSFTYEAYDSKFFLRGLKAYQYIDLKGKVAGVCGHISKTDPRRLEFGAIPPVKHSDNNVVFVDEDGTIKEVF